MKKIIIIGGKGTAVVIAEQIQDAIDRFGADLEVLGFAFDDPKYENGINGWPVLCGTKEAYEKYKGEDDVYFIFSLYKSNLIYQRIELRDSLQIPNERFFTFIHPLATICRSATIGNGCVILSNCSINTNVKIGNFNTILSNVVIEHDTIIGNNNFITAHCCIGSGIRIGDFNFWGLNSSCKTNCKIGNNNLIGMSSNVLKNIYDNSVVIGNPAIFLRNNNCFQNNI